MNHYDTLFVSKNKTIAVRVELACLIGLNEAIVLNQIEYWLELYRNEPGRFQDKHYRDGKWWVFNSFTSWKEQFPFWSIRTLKRIFKKLRDSNLIIGSSKYNERGYDKTMWYTINYDAVFALDNKNEDSEEDPSVKMTPTLGTNCHQTQCQNGTTNTKDYHTIDYITKDIKDIVSDSDKNTDHGKTSDSAEVTDIGEYRRSGHITSWKGWGSNKDYWNYIDKVLPNKLDDFHYFCVKYFYDSYLANMGEPHPPYSQKNLEKVVGLIDMYDYGSLEHFEKAVDSFFSKDIDGGYQLLLFLTEGFQKNIGYEMERLEV